MLRMEPGVWPVSSLAAASILIALSTGACDGSTSNPASSDAGRDAIATETGGAAGSGGVSAPGGTDGGGGAGATAGKGGQSPAGSGGAAGASGTGGTSTGGRTTGGTSGGGGLGTGGRQTGGAGGKGSGGSGGKGSGGRTGAGGTGSTSASRHTAIPLGGANTAPNGYWEYLPPNYDGSAPTPLLVFWHGIGEDGNGGSDLQKVTANGPPQLIQASEWPDARPFIVLSPQYTGVSGEIAPGKGCPASANVNAFITWALTHYNVDPKRVFLSGLSCGAIGSWDYLADHKGAVVAAAVLICGNPGDPTTAGSAWQRAGCGIGESAIWSFHGDQDGTVPYAPDHDTMQKLLACPSPPRRAATFTTVPGGQHNIWEPVYDLSGGYGDVYGWLLDNAKP